MNKKWSVHLTNEERVELEKIIKKRKSSARVIRRAQTLLFADEKKADCEISSLLRCSETCVYITRRAYCEYGWVLAEIRFSFRYPINPRRGKVASNPYDDKFLV